MERDINYSVRKYLPLTNMRVTSGWVVNDNNCRNGDLKSISMAEITAKNQMENISFKEGVRQTVIECSQKYKSNYVDFDYLVCSNLLESCDIMSDIRFKASLTAKEIEKNFQGADVFSGIMDGLTEALAYEKGKVSAETFSRKQALPVVNVLAIRNSLSMTQRAFANVLGVSCRTVEAWECGKSSPSPIAKKLMYLIQIDHSLVDKLV